MRRWFGVSVGFPLFGLSLIGLGDFTMTSKNAEARVIVVDPKGVHIRTGQLLCARLRWGGFDADLFLSCARGEAFVPRAGSVWPFAVLSLGARRGDEVLVTSTGEGAGEVVRVVCEILGSPVPGHGAVLREGLAQVSREIGQLKQTTKGA